MKHVVVVMLAAALAGTVAAAAAAQGAPGAARPEGWVVLSVAEYEALRLKAYPPPPPPDVPPLSATITLVEYDLRVEGDSAVGQARLTADVFKEGWVAIPIPPGLRVREARVDSAAVPLAADPQAKESKGQVVLLSRTGRSLISLDVVVPVAAKSGTESLLLPPAPAPVQRIALAVPGVDLVVSATGGFIAERSTTAGSTRVVVFGRPGEPASFSWGRRRDTPTSAQPLRLRGAVNELVGLSEDAAQVSAQVAFEVVQGLADRVSIAFPQGFVVSGVSGSLVADWEAQNDQCAVALLEPVEQRVEFTVVGEMRVPRDGRISVPLVRPAGVERETGGVAVEVLGAGEIKERVVLNLDPADPSELGEAIAARQSPALAAFRFRAQAAGAPRSLDVTVARYTPQAVLLANIEEARYRAVAAEDGKTLVEARYAVRNSQRSFLAVRLPTGATLWSASIDGRPARPGSDQNGALLLPILKARGADRSMSSLTVLYVDRSSTWENGGTATVRLPAVDLPVSRTGLLVYHSPRFRLTLEPGPFRIQPYAPPASAALREGARPESGLARQDAAGAGRSQVRAEADRELQALADAYQRSARSNAVAGLLPVELPFPAVGPSVYLAAELADEGKSPEARFTLKRLVK